MKKSTKIKLLAVGIIGVVGIIAVILLQLQTGFIGNKKVEEAKEEYYDTYGLSEEDWELLNAEGITIEDAHAMEMQSNRISAVGELLDEILVEIKNGTYHSNKENKSNVKERVLENFSDIEGTWEAVDKFDGEKNVYSGLLYVKITIDKDTDPLLFDVTVYNEKDEEEKLSRYNYDATKVSSDHFTISSPYHGVVNFNKYSSEEPFEMGFNNCHYDLKRISEDEFNDIITK